MFSLSQSIYGNEAADRMDDSISIFYNVYEHQK
jgi:hypothetical protein